MALLLADSFRPLNDNWSPVEVSTLYEDFGRQIGGFGLCGTWSCRVSKLLKPLQSEMIQCVPPFTLSTMTQSIDYPTLAVLLQTQTIDNKKAQKKL